MPKVAKTYDLASATEVVKLSCPEGKQAAYFWDDSRSSLALKITSVGLMTYVYRARPLPGQPVKEHGFGPAHNPPVLEHVKLVRDKCLAMDWQRKHEGKDPFLALNDPRDALTANEVVDQYIDHLNKSVRHKTGLVFTLFRKAFGSTPVGQITGTSITDWIEATYTQASPAQRILALGHAAFGHAMKTTSKRRLPAGMENPFQDLLKTIPLVADYEPEGYAVVWSDEDWAKIREGFRKGHIFSETQRRDGNNEMGLLCLEMIMLTGARPTEIRSLTWNQIDSVRIDHQGGHRFNQAIVKDRHKNYGKTKRPRRILLDDGAANILKRARKLAEQDGYLTGDPKKDATKLVFYSHCQHMKGKDGMMFLERLVKRMRLWTGIETFQTYNFRSAYINRALDRIGFHYIDVVAENIGHDIKTTMKYYRVHHDTKIANAVQQVGQDFARDFGFLWDTPTLEVAEAA